jgi:glycosyltransferase involved in cell wall biosynthesis
VKTLFCSPIPTEDPRLGASRVIIDIAEAWRSQGWECDVYSAQGENVSFADYPAHLAEYLRECAIDYDVVDYPYNCVPWIEKRHANTLKVARVVLLQEHCQFEDDPSAPLSLRKCVSSLLHARSQAERKKATSQSLLNQQINVQRSDLVTVGNQKDKDCLIQLGVSALKIMVLPYGLTEAHKERLFQCTPSLENTTKPTIVFLGTFDYRKGCLDWSEILPHVSEFFPSVKLKLIGTRGMCYNSQSVLRYFPKNVRDRISVVPTFEPETLPGLLNGCSMGVFPSYREGFGIGVVEMLAAGLPVVAYDAPGPCDILPTEWLVPKGDRISLANSIVSLLNEPQRSKLEGRARSIAGQFLWTEIAGRTYDIYRRALHGLP